MPARLVDDDEAIAAVTVGENEAAFFERGLESPCRRRHARGSREWRCGSPAHRCRGGGILLPRRGRRLAPDLPASRVPSSSRKSNSRSKSRASCLRWFLYRPGSIARIVLKIDAAPADMHVPLADRREYGNVTMRGWPAKPSRFSSRSAISIHCSRRELLAGGKPRLGVKERLRRSAYACRRTAAASRTRQPDRGRSRRGRAPRRIQRSSPRSPVMRYRARLPPSPWRLPFAITAQGGLNGGERHGKHIRRAARIAASSASIRSSRRRLPCSCATSASSFSARAIWFRLLPTRLSSTRACVSAAVSTDARPSVHARAVSPLHGRVGRSRDNRQRSCLPPPLLS